MANEEQGTEPKSNGSTPDEQQPVEEAPPVTLETLRGELEAERTERAKMEANQLRLERMLAASDKALGELRSESNESNLETLQARKQSLVEEIAAAHEAGDIRLELQLRDKYTETNDEIKSAKRPPLAPASADEATRRVMEDPVYQKWLNENKWFGHDAAMSGAALSLMNELNGTLEGQQMTPQQRFDRVTAEVKRRFRVGVNERRSGVDRVEGSRGEGGFSNEGNSWENLPAEAKSQCDKLATRFVGKADAEGKVKYKNLSEYRAHYANDYFDSGWGVKQLTRY